MRCLSRGIICAYGSSTAADAQSASPRTSLRKQSLSGLKPRHLKLSPRTRSAGESSVVERETNTERADLHASSSEFKVTTDCEGFCDSITTNLDDDPLNFSRVSLVGDDFESPVGPLIPLISSPKANPSYKISGLSRYIFFSLSGS